MKRDWQYKRKVVISINILPMADNYGNLATSEALRKYWSWFQFANLSLGTPNA
jgi:hypothetical protein